MCQRSERNVLFSKVLRPAREAGEDEVIARMCPDPCEPGRPLSAGMSVCDRKGEIGSDRRRERLLTCPRDHTIDVPRSSCGDRLFPLQWSRPTGNVDYRPWVTASAFLAWVANGGFRQNRKSASHFSLRFAQFRWLSGFSLELSARVNRLGFGATHDQQVEAGSRSPRRSG